MILLKTISSKFLLLHYIKLNTREIQLLLTKCAYQYSIIDQ